MSEHIDGLFATRPPEEILSDVSMFLAGKTAAYVDIEDPQVSSVVAWWEPNAVEDTVKHRVVRLPQAVVSGVKYATLRGYRASMLAVSGEAAAETTSDPYETYSSVGHTAVSVFEEAEYRAANAYNALTSLRRLVCPLLAATIEDDIAPGFRLLKQLSQPVGGATTTIGQHRLLRTALELEDLTAPPGSGLLTTLGNDLYSGRHDGLIIADNLDARNKNDRNISSSLLGFFNTLVASLTAVEAPDEKTLIAKMTANPSVFPSPLQSEARRGRQLWLDRFALERRRNADFVAMRVLNIDLHQANNAIKIMENIGVKVTVDPMVDEFKKASARRRPILRTRPSRRVASDSLSGQSEETQEKVQLQIATTMYDKNYSPTNKTLEEFLAGRRTEQAKFAETIHDALAYVAANFAGHHNPTVGIKKIETVDDLYEFKSDRVPGFVTSENWFGQYRLLFCVKENDEGVRQVCMIDVIPRHRLETWIGNFKG